MAGQTLTTTILINARAGNGFAEVGNTLLELGAMANQVSQQLIDFGKDSIDVYRDYEKSMKDAEVALSTTYGRNTAELSSVMKTLDASATEWAATTIFHTDDVANAISEAAHAGWDLDQIMSGIPAAMQLAQAGGLDLSESVNYIVKSTSAAGVGFEDLGHFMDLWAFAANSSASTIGEFGDAMLRMGSTMRFAANPEELMTLIAVTANAGQVGSEAGTLIRNSMMRLVAPTKKAKEAMAELGATSLEASGLMDDEALAASNARLAAVGFSAFDEQGNLRNVLDIYKDLYVALGEVAGGFENIDKNQDALGILSSIFPTRTITEALTLLRGAAEGYDGLYEAMMGGDAEGYGQYASETMMDTLNGKIETFESKVERLKQVVGEELAPQLETVLDSLGGLVDNIAGMDDASFSVLVSGLEVLAAAGPGLLVAGGAIKFFGTAIAGIASAGPVSLAAGSIALLGLAIAGVASAAERIREIDFEDTFGNLELDDSAITGYAQGIAGAFDNTYASIKSARDELTGLVEQYNTTAADIKRELISSMITGEELTDEQKRSIRSMADQATGHLQSSIEANQSEVMGSLATTFGDDTDNPLVNNLMRVVESEFASEISRAEELSRQFRDALTSAFKDGTINEEDLQGLQDIFDQMNELVAQQQDIENYVAEQRLFRKSQTLGLDAIEGTASDIAELRDSRLGFLADEQARAYRRAELSYGAKAGTPGAQKALAALRESQEAEYYAAGADFNAMQLRLYEEGIQSNQQLSDAWNSLGTAASSFVESGGILSPEALETLNTLSVGEWGNMATYTESMIEALGGREAVSGYADYYAGIGDAATEAQYRQLMAMYDISGGHNPVQAGGTLSTSGDYARGGYDREWLANQLQGYGYAETPEDLFSYMTEQSGRGLTPDWATYFQGADSAMYQALNNAAQSAGTDISGVISDAMASNPVRAKIEPEEFDPTTSADIDPIQVPVEPQMEDVELEDQNVNVPVDADTAAASGAIDELDGQNLTENVGGDTSALSSAIDAQDNRQLTAYVNGNTSALAAAINSLNGRTITVNIAKRQLFAEGGRATTASIFGEAGPEWAIPEEHSQRTAELLDAARAASGFTWPDLLSRLGGMNSDAGASPTTIVYSPTINANDASGVEAALREDKFRLERWFEERQMRDRMEVYA